MAVFYRGAGIGTYWHANDARSHGFVSHNPGGGRGVHEIVNHVRNGTTFSPFVSLTRSFGVAKSYALFGRAKPTPGAPAFVYEIHLQNPLPAGLGLIDPLHELSHQFRDPCAPGSYQHDGDPDFLLGVVSPAAMAPYLAKPCSLPPPGGATSRPPNLSNELETMVRVLRDAEVLAVGAMPATCVVNRFDIC